MAPGRAVAPGAGVLRAAPRERGGRAPVPGGGLRRPGARRRTAGRAPSQTGDDARADVRADAVGGGGVRRRHDERPLQGRQRRRPAGDLRGRALAAAQAARRAARGRGARRRPAARTLGPAAHRLRAGRAGASVPRGARRRGRVLGRRAHRAGRQHAPLRRLGTRGPREGDSDHARDALQPRLDRQAPHARRGGAARRAGPALARRQAREIPARLPERRPDHPRDAGRAPLRRGRHLQREVPGDGPLEAAPQPRLPGAHPRPAAVVRAGPGSALLERRLRAPGRGDREGLGRGLLRLPREARVRRGGHEEHGRARRG